MNQFSQYSVEPSEIPKGWVLVSRKLGGGYESRKIRPALLGVPGAAGLPGLTGASGGPGVKGLTGPAGNSGPQGDAGATGPNGVAGTFADEITFWDCACFESWEQYEDGAAISGLNGGLGFLTPWAGAGASVVIRTNKDGSVERRMSIGNGWTARRMPWGSNWNAVEISFTARLNRPPNADFNSTTGSGFYIGIGSGEVDNSTFANNFIGIRAKEFPTLFQYSGGTQTPHYTQVSGRRFIGKVGAAETVALSSGSSFPSFSIDEGRKSIYTVRFDRDAFVGTSSVSYFSALRNGTNSSEYDYPKQTILETYARRGNLSDTLAQPVLVESSSQVWSESAGVLDTLSLTWGWSTPLEISSIAVRRVY